jgi:hypothetical protein
MLFAGCAGGPEKRSPGAASRVHIIVDQRLHGRIVTLNQAGQFVVVDFNVGVVPSRMNVYRGNKIVGVINLAGPRNDNLVAGDIVSGEAAVGDEAILDDEKSAPAPAARP